MMLLLNLLMSTTVLPNQEYVSWKSEPTVRGTWSILSSCVATLILCAYSAVHMNIMHPYERIRSRRLRQSKWVVAAIFTPEIVVLAAWSQWLTAKLLSKKIKELQDATPRSAEEAPFDPKYHHKYRSIHDLADTWTLQHSFFVIMGGFQFPPDEVAPNPDSPGRPRCMINIDLFMFLLEEGHVEKIPVLTQDDLADRSKADYIAKIVACMQGLWLAVQLLGRLIARLTITELEVNTFAHVICAVAMYALWMSKPLNPVCPVWVNTEGLDDWVFILSGLRRNVRFGLAFSRIKSNDPTSGHFKTHWHDAKTWKAPFECPQCSVHRSELGRRVAVGLFINTPASTPTPTDLDWLVDVLLQDQSTFLVDFVMCGDFRNWEDWGAAKPKSPKEWILFEVKNQKELEAFLRAWQLLHRPEPINPLDNSLSLHRRTDMITSTTDNEDQLVTSMFCMLAVSCAYGAIHASLWNHHFPTVAEGWLWRISSIVVAGNAVFDLFACVIVVQTMDLFKRARKSSTAVVKLSATIAMRFGLGIICMAQLGLLFGRIFLVVEAFISLRSQPASVYETPQWSQWFLHL